jgi:2,4-dienoyl-CoA reductase-like NADH-dependent reductase (Old Yellow Enzyme family)
LLRESDRLGLLEYDPHVLSTDEVYELAADFGRSAGYAVEAGYDGIHLAGANMGIVQQFLSPFYNRRDDEFGGDLRGRIRFLSVVHDEIRERAGDVPLVTKVPAETGSPRVVRRRLSERDAVEICRACEAIGFDAVVPVRGSVFWDMSVVRGEHPERAWNDERFGAGYEAAFGSRWRVVALANRIHARRFGFEPAWNAGLCRRVRERVSIPVLCEGGIREPERIDSLLGDACDAVGMGRPFYAEPRLPARVLAGEGVVCENCNNCTVPQVTGADGVCRTPSVLERRGELARSGAYERGRRS